MIYFQNRAENFGVLSKTVKAFFTAAKPQNASLLKLN